MGSFSIWHWLIVFLYIPLVAIYHLPTSLAIYRKTDKALIVQIINVFLGWTIVGWVVALVMALSSKKLQSESR